MSERIRQVVVGTVKVGDIIDGYRVTGFGRSWAPQDDEHNAGYSTETWNDRVCYAYGEKVGASAPTPTGYVNAMSDAAGAARDRRMAEAAKPRWQQLEEAAAAIEATVEYHPEAYRAARLEKAAALRAEAASLKSA